VALIPELPCAGKAPGPLPLISLDGILNPDQEFMEQAGYSANPRTVAGFPQLRYSVDRLDPSFQAFVSLVILILCLRRVVHDAR